MGLGIQPPHVPQMVITASQIQWTADVTKCLLTAIAGRQEDPQGHEEKSRWGNTTRMTRACIRAGRRG